MRCAKRRTGTADGCWRAPGGTAWSCRASAASAKERSMTARPAVLVVDDDEAIRTFLTHLLSARGYAVDSVDSGAQAIARVAGGLAPAVAIVDIMMPGVDGLEVLARLKGI